VLRRHHLVDGAPGFNPGTGGAGGEFSLQRGGSTQVCAGPTENVGKRFAAVLDKEVLSAGDQGAEPAGAQADFRQLHD